MNQDNQPYQPKKVEFKNINGAVGEVLCFLSLVKLADRYAFTNQDIISKEIGRVSMDLIEPEFATLDRRNLLERKKFLEYEYEKLEKLKKIDEYEQKFINNGKDAVESLGISADSLLHVGVPRNTLKAAGII